MILFEDKNVNNDNVSKQIEEKGKSIDALSTLIEHSTDNMEDEIEKAGKDIDSPDAQKRIEIAGNDVDKLADEMDEKTEKEGKLSWDFLGFSLGFSLAFLGISLFLEG